MSRSQSFIREATADDVEELAKLAASTFRDTFEDRNEPANMDSYLGQWFSVDRIRSELDDSNSTFFLAFGDPHDPPIGYVKLKAGQTAAAVQGPDPVELERLYVSRQTIGTGVGAALMQTCLAESADAGFRTIWLGVWEKNEPAIAFYERWGFEIVGSHIFLLGSDEQTDMIMERPVHVAGEA